MPSYRPDDQMKGEIAVLLPHYKDQTDLLHAAVHLLWRLRRMEEMRGLILDLDIPLEEVVYRAVLELWQREIGEPDRDLASEVDELRARLDRGGL